jgi:hypothetical protein
MATPEDTECLRPAPGRSCPCGVRRLPVTRGHTLRVAGERDAFARCRATGEDELAESHRPVPLTPASTLASGITIPLGPALMTPANAVNSVAVRIPASPFATGRGPILPWRARRFLISPPTIAGGRRGVENRGLSGLGQSPDAALRGLADGRRDDLTGAGKSDQAAFNQIRRDR